MKFIKSNSGSSSQHQKHWYHILANIGVNLLYIAIGFTVFYWAAYFIFFYHQKPNISIEEIEQHYSNINIEDLVKISQDKSIIELGIKKFDTTTHSVTHKVKKNEFLFNILYSMGFKAQDINGITEIIKKHRLSFYEGQELYLEYTAKHSFTTQGDSQADTGFFYPPIHKDNSTLAINLISFKTSPEVFFIISRSQDGQKFESQEKKIDLIKKITLKSGKITGSVFYDGLQAGISADTINSAINLYSYDIDFQRDIRKGDEFTFFYEEYFSKENGSKIKDGKLLYVSLSIFGSKKEYYFFDRLNDYFDRKGKSVKKFLMKTPINGARISSVFGFRRHPILGYSRLHKGMDFAAASGTPIFAGGDGVIDFIGWNGTARTGYGRYIKIRHNSTYATAYGHMSRFKVGLKRGSKVKQGQVIGYVGSTGGSTGPHLHYEILKNGVQINPRKIKGIDVKEIAKSQMVQFKENVAEIDALMAKSKAAK